MIKDIRFGLIGAGRWGRVYIKTLAQFEGAKLALVASRNPETSALVPSGCRVLEDWKALVASPEIDAVIVASPPSLHYEMGAAAIAAKKAVLMEKPLTDSLKDAEALLALAESSGALVWVQHTQLFHPAYRELKKRARGIMAARSMGGNHGPFREGTPPLWDYAAHDLSIFLDLLGLPTSVLADRLPAETPDGELFELMLEHEGGVPTRAVVGNGMAKKARRLEVDAEDGTYCFDEMKADKLTLSSRGKTQSIPIDPTPPLTIALREFCAALREGRHDLAPLKLGVEVVRALEECSHAAH